MSIALPITIAQLAQQGMSFVDMAMSGRAGANDLAGVAIGNAIWTPMYLFIIGVTAISPALIAHACGEKNRDKVINLAHQTLWIGLLLGLAGMILCLLNPWYLPLLDLSPAVEAQAGGYLNGIAGCALAIGGIQSLRAFTEGQANTRIVMRLTLLGLLLNIPANYALIFGHWGMPALGGAGCGWATTAVTVTVFVVFCGYIAGAKRLKFSGYFEKIYLPQKDLLLSIIKLGVPVGLAIFFESSMFAVVSLMIAGYGALVMAGHQIAYNVSATLFMVPLSIGMAISIRAGYLLGRDQVLRARQTCFLGMATAVACSLVFITILLSFPDAIARIYTEQPEVIHIAGGLFFLAALFQFSDAIQVTAAGALRAYKDTRATMIITSMAYWLVGLPSGYLIAETFNEYFGLGYKGYWLCLIVGLSTAAILLTRRLNWLSQKPIMQASVVD